jgi:hypothetical protein
MARGWAIEKAARGVRGLSAGWEKKSAEKLVFIAAIRLYGSKAFPTVTG